MKKINPHALKSAEILRIKAEEMMKTHSPRSVISLSESDLLKLVHELEVHKIELQIQNDELLIAKEKAAKLAEDKYAELYDLAPTGYFTISKEGEILELNLCGARMLGKERLHLINSRFGFFISEDTKPIFNHFLNELFSSKNPKICEVILRDSNNTTKYVQLTGIESHLGGQCLITMADISGQMEAQARIRHNEVFLRTAQMIAGLGTFSLDLVNSSWESSEVLDLIFGIDPDFDKSFEGWMAIVHPEWQKKMRAYFHQLVVEHDSIFEIEYKILRMNDHAERWIHVTGQIEFDARKRPVALLGALADITARKLIEERLRESEKSYQSLISNLHIGVLVQGPLAEILLSNNRALELLGLTEDQLLGKTSFDADWNVIHEDGSPYPGPSHPVPQCIATRQPVRNAVMGVFRPTTGDRVWLLVNADPELNPDGKVKEIICTFKDITDRKMVEDELFQTTIRLNQAQEISNMGSFSFEIATNTIIATSQSDRIFGFNSDQTNGLSAWEPLIHPDDCKIMQALLTACLEQGIPFEKDYRIYRQSDYEPRWLHGIYRAEKDSSGKVIRLSGVNIDITERKKLEETLLSSERQYRDIFQKNNAVKLVIDPDSGTIITANQAAAKFYGYSVSQLETMNINEINVLSPELITTEMTLAVNEKRKYFNFLHRLASGEIRNVEVYSGPIDSGGRILLYSIIHDITDRRLAEEKLARSESFLNSIVDFSPNSLWISDEHGTLIRMNNACRDLLQIQDDEVVGKYNILNDNLMEDQGFMQEVINVFEKSEKTSFTMAYDTSKVKNLQLKNTKKADLDINISPVLDLNGKLTNAIIQHTDITNLKQIEANLKLNETRFRTILENSYDAIGVHVNGIWDMCNPAALKLFGVDSCDELLGTSILNVISTEERTRIGSFIRSRMEDSSAPDNYLTRGLRKDGSEFDMNVRLSTFILENKRHILVILRDITESLKNQKVLLDNDAEIKRKNEELQKVNAEKDRLFSVIAHDLRSPFNGFLGLTELMCNELKDMSTEDIQKSAQLMRNSANNLFDLLGNLLEWSRMQRGLITFLPTSVLLKVKFEESSNMLKDSIVKKKITLIDEIPHDLKVWAEENMLNSILRNLVSNALKFTPKGGIIVVSAKLLPDKMVEISVRDSGIGMSKQLIDNLFKIDAPVGRKGTDGELSTGLGLIICKDFIEKNGGEIEVFSEVGIGSVFRFTIPTIE